MSLYTEIVARGIPHEHHQSDLYIPYTPETKELLEKHMKAGTPKPSGFVHNETKEAWLDIPFAYDPYWEKQARREMKIPANNT